jgi:hypothetical protein
MSAMARNVLSHTASISERHRIFPSPSRSKNTGGGLTAVMLFFCGMLYPAQGTAPPEPGYDLSLAELNGVVASFGDMAVTMEHIGLHDAIDTLHRKGNLCPATFATELESVADNELAKPVGRVLELFFAHDSSLWCIAEIYPLRADIIKFLVELGGMRGLSMTHVRTGDTITAIEVSLCAYSRRPKCGVAKLSNSVVDVREYKRRIQHQTYVSPGSKYRTTATTMSAAPDTAASNNQTGSTPTTTESPEVSTAAVMERVLAGLSPAERTAYEKRLGDLVKRGDEHSTRAAALEKRLAETESGASKTKFSHDLMKQNLVELLKGLPPALVDATRTEPNQLYDDLMSKESAVYLDGLERLVYACNKSSREHRVGQLYNTPDTSNNNNNTMMAATMEPQRKRGASAAQLSGSADEGDITRIKRALADVYTMH